MRKSGEFGLQKPDSLFFLAFHAFLSYNGIRNGRKRNIRKYLQKFAKERFSSDERKKPERKAPERRETVSERRSAKMRTGRNDNRRFEMGTDDYMKAFNVMNRHLSR